MTSVLLAAASAGLALMSRAALRSWSHPLVVYLLLWAGVLATVALNPLGLSRMDTWTVGVLAAGIVATTVGGLALPLIRPAPTRARAAPRPLATDNLLTALAVVGVLLAAGVLLFRQSLSAAAGVPIDALSPSQVRFLTVQGAARGGLGGLALSLAPIASCLAVALVARSRWAWLVAAAPIAVTAITPARSVTVVAVAITVLFWLYSRPRVSPGRPLPRARTLAIALLLGAGAVGYFEYQGELLGKSTHASAHLQGNDLPEVLVPSTLYASGSPVAFAAAHIDNVDPSGGSGLRSVWLLPRLLSVVDSDTEVPDTVAEFVRVPIDFNTYTWIGDVWFDFGMLGVIAFGLMLGGVASGAHALAVRRSSLAAYWVGAVVITLFLSSIIALRFFWLETALWLVLGTAIFWICDRRRSGVPAVAFARMSVGTHSGGTESVVRVFQRQWRVIAATTIVLGLLALGWSLAQEKRYTASASLLFRDPGFDQKLFGSSVLEPARDPAREAATNVRLVSLEAVADRAERRLPGVTHLQEQISIEPEGQSDVISVSATDPNPERAARIANTVASEYIAFRREADRAKIREAQRFAGGQLDRLSTSRQPAADAKSLRDRLEQLEILASLQTGNAELVQRASTPTDPSSPRTARNVAFGGLLGLLVGLAFALTRARFDRRVRAPRELQEIFERPLLAATPHIRSLDRADRRAIDLDPVDVEAFRMLRANLRYFNVDREIKSVLVTSAAAGDGKTTVAANLAAAAAAAGERALLVEADLRRPTLGRALRAGTTIGLTGMLTSDAALPDAVAPISLGGSAGAVEDAAFDVLFTGALPPNPGDLLESERMRRLLKEAVDVYDLVVVDTPPTSAVSDAVPLMALVDGVVVLARMSATTRDALSRLQQQLHNLGAPTLGVVANGVSAADSAGYGYAYGYGRNGEPAALALPAAVGRRD